MGSMMERTRDRLGLIFFVACLIFASCAPARADNLVRFYLEGQANGFYGDNIPLKTSDEIGDFGTVLVAGFFLDYTSAERYASLHYDTFAQLFTHQTRLDRAGEGQSVAATDTENLSPTTKLYLDDYYYRDASAVLTVTTSDQSPAFNTSLALLLFAEEQASINQFNAELTHYWGQNWSSEFDVHQTTSFGNQNNGAAQSGESFEQSVSAITDYHFTGSFSLGLGYRFYDFRFTFPGQPGQQAHWAFARLVYQLTRDVSLSGIVGPVITHTQGENGDQVNPAGLGLLEYRFERGTASIYGGQEPSLTSTFGTVGIIRGFRGTLLYDFTSRLTGIAGGSYYESTGDEFNGKFVSWGVSLTQRLNRYFDCYAKFVQLRRNETASSPFLPSGTSSGQWAVGDYYIVGLSVSFEAFRWSWR